MPTLILSLLLSWSFAQAGIDGLKVKNLSLDYISPKGQGEMEKLSINGSFKGNATYPFEVNRTETAFELLSPFLDFTWNRPWSFVHDLEKIQVQNLDVSAGSKVHSVRASHLVFKPNGQDRMMLDKVNALCEGDSVEAKIEHRLLDDCRKKLELTVKALDVPTSFIIMDIFAQLPPQEPMKDYPADNLTVKIVEGDFSLLAYTRIVLRAGVRAWGNISYEKNHKAIIIEVDQIKFGYLPVTSIVMRELRKRIKVPNVTIGNRIIRIDLP